MISKVRKESYNKETYGKNKQLYEKFSPFSRLDLGLEKP